MIAAFSAADQLRRRPAPVNTSIRRTGSGICLCSEIDMCRSPRVGFEHHPSAARPKGAAQTPLTLKLGYCCESVHPVPAEVHTIAVRLGAPPEPASRPGATQAIKRSENLHWSG